MSKTDYKHHRLRGRVANRGEEFVYIQQPYVEWEFVTIPDYTTQFYISRLGTTPYIRDNEYLHTLYRKYPQSLFNAKLILCLPEWFDRNESKILVRIEIEYNGGGPEKLEPLYLKRIEGSVKGYEIEWEGFERVVGSLTIEEEVEGQYDENGSNHVKIYFHSIQAKRIFYIRTGVSHKGINYCTYINTPSVKFGYNRSSLIFVTNTFSHITKRIEQGYDVSIDSSYDRETVFDSKYLGFIKYHNWLIGGENITNYIVNIDTSVERDIITPFYLYLESYTEYEW